MDELTTVMVISLCLFSLGVGLIIGYLMGSIGTLARIKRHGGGEG